jgi:DNA-binding transcriptional MocR family regulator
MLSEAELRALVDLAARHGCRLLVDETYRDLSFERPDRCFRLGYGWPTPQTLEAGLAAISSAL